MKTIFSKSVVIGLVVIVFFFCKGMKCVDDEELRNCWEDNTVPYKIDTNFSSAEKAHIHRVLEHIMNNSCLQWVNIGYNPKLRKNLPLDPIYFERIDSDICQFRREITTVVLGDHCFQMGYVLHEVMHTLGFYHEHQRVDRACYVEVDDDVKENGNFQIHKTPNLDTFPYDKRSVMHYPKEFGLHSRLDPNEPLGSEKEELTDLDIWKLQFKFCRRPHYCRVHPFECQAINDWENKEACVV